jgi:ABC-type transport system substrate-binding protein
MRRWRRLPLGIRAVLAVVLAVGLIALAGSAQAQKRGGTLTIVRPTDPVSLDPHTETTAPARGSTTTSWSRSSTSTRR